MNLLEKEKLKYPLCRERIEEINTLLDDLILRKKSKISVREGPLIPIVTWKLRSYVQTSLHRTIDLSFETCKAWENDSPAAAFLLTRAVWETVSYSFDFTNQAISGIEKNDLHEINILINKLMFGERTHTKLPKVDNVLTVLDRITKIIPKYRENYEKISNFCHPNYSALGKLYSLQENEHLYFKIGKEYGIREDYFNIIIYSLSASLGIQRMTMERFDIIYPKLEKLEKIEMKK